MSLASDFLGSYDWDLGPEYIGRSNEADGQVFYYGFPDDSYVKAIYYCDPDTDDEPDDWELVEDPDEITVGLFLERIIK